MRGGTTVKHLLETSGLLWREEKSQVAAPDSSKVATRGVLYTLEAGPHPVPPQDSSLAAPKILYPCAEGGEILGSSLRLLQGSHPGSSVDIGGMSMPGSSLGLLPGSFQSPSASWGRRKYPA